jgi:hypothetical protein
MKDQTRSIQVKETPQSVNWWGEWDIVREIKSVSNKQPKEAKPSEVVNTSKPRKVVSKRTEKPSKERKKELVQEARARVVSNQQELKEIIKYRG